MLAQLPKSVQEQVLGYLNVKDFALAKKVHDQWMDQHPVIIPIHVAFPDQGLSDLVA